MRKTGPPQGARMSYSTAGRIPDNGVRAVGALGARPAASGIPTIYTQCQELTKDGTTCSAPPIHGGRTCVGHSRKGGK